MKIMTIDPGYTRLGWAVGEVPNKFIACGTMYFVREDRITEIHERIKEKIQEYNVEHIYIEDYKVYKKNKNGYKTLIVIGLIAGIAKSLGSGVSAIPYTKWNSEFDRVYGLACDYLSDPWKHALLEGSEHSRDAVKMLLTKVIDLQKLLPV